MSNNYEVWDKDLFGIICPGKQRVIGWDNWMKRSDRGSRCFW